jgi:hypothetical protein
MYIEVVVKLTGLSERVVCDFQTVLHFADVWNSVSHLQNH